MGNVKKNIIYRVSCPPTSDCGLTKDFSIFEYVFWTRKNVQIIEFGRIQEKTQEKTTHFEKQKKNGFYHFKIAISSIFLSNTRFFLTKHGSPGAYHPPTTFTTGKSQLNSGSTAKLAKPKPSTPSNSKVIKGSCFQPILDVPR